MIKRGRKRNPASPRSDVRKLTAPDKIALLGTLELAKLKDTWAAVFSQKLEPAAALERLARALQYYQAPAPHGAGRRRDPALEHAARLYVSAVENKEIMRTMGVGGLKPEKRTLHAVAALCFPGDEAAIAKAEERVKNAARKYRKIKRG
jgi:hypothetical protein